MEREIYQYTTLTEKANLSSNFESTPDQTSVHLICTNYLPLSQQIKL